MRTYAHRSTVKTNDERFWEKVAWQEPTPTGCWLWTGATHGHMGYGCFCADWDFASRRYLRHGIGAHRYAWEWAFGTVNSGLLVLHACDTPLCCNPEHLFLGTAKQNTEDMRAKGRMPEGENHPRAKLTDAAVSEILAAFAPGGITHQKLADRYGVSRTRIGQIVRQKRR